MYEYLDRRYALALYEVAEKNGKVDEYLGDLREICELIDKDEEFQEDLSNDTLTTVATTFLENIPSQNKKGIYANHNWWTTKLTDKKLNDYIKWKARYNNDPIIEDEYQILQYSETGSIKGIIGNVDLNITTTKYWQ